MNLKRYSLKDLLLTALKSEVESNLVYTKIAKTVKNGLLKDKLEFLAKEEEKHRQFIEEIYKEQFAKTTLIIPKKTPVPLPEILIPDQDTPISTILTSAMRVEQAAHDFYKSLSKQFIKEKKIQNMLSYFADMELQHYKILEIEKESMERFEEADIYWPMVHAGP